MNHVYATANLADACLYHSGEPCPDCVEYWTQVWAVRAEEEMLRPKAKPPLGIKGQPAVQGLSLGGDLVFRSGVK